MLMHRIWTREYILNQPDQVQSIPQNHQMIGCVMALALIRSS